MNKIETQGNGRRSSTGVAVQTTGEGELAEDRATATQRPDPEVQERPQRRRFDAAYKRRVLAEAEASPGEVGALLRREGLYSSHLTTWRKQRAAGELAGLAPRKRGRKGKERGALSAELA